jgi:3-oxosteroid 1-dehydrogenase
VLENRRSALKTNTGDGIRAGLQAGAAVDLMDEAWWFPTLSWPTGP